MKNKTYLLNLIALISIYVINGAGSFENAAVQTMVEAWPNLTPATIRLMITLPSLTSTMVMMVVGQFVGKKISFRNTLILGSLFILTDGVLPFFVHTNWYFILACRIVLGLGMGMLSIRSSMLMLSAKPEDTARFIGLGAVIGSLVSATIAPITGTLTKLGWYYPFLTNGIIIIALIMILCFVQEPEKTLEKKKASGKAKIPTLMYILLLAQFILTLVLYPLLSGISTYLVELNLGDASVAGMMLSLYTGSGIVTNLCLKQLQKTFKAYVLPFFLLLPAIGLALVLFTHNIILVAIGIFISGTGFITFSSTVQLYAGAICDENTIVKVSPYLLAMTQFGVFLSSYFIDFTSKLGWFNVEMQNPYFICLLIYLGCAIIAFIYRNKIYPYKQN